MTGGAGASKARADVDPKRSSGMFFLESCRMEKYAQSMLLQLQQVDRYVVDQRARCTVHPGVSCGEIVHDLLCVGRCQMFAHSCQGRSHRMKGRLR